MTKEILHHYKFPTMKLYITSNDGFCCSHITPNDGFCYSHITPNYGFCYSHITPNDGFCYSQITPNDAVCYSHITPNDVFCYSRNLESSSGVIYISINATFSNLILIFPNTDLNNLENILFTVFFKLVHIFKRIFLKKK